MWDFAYRVAMDTYEQANGKIRIKPVEPGLPTAPQQATSRLLGRLLSALQAWQVKGDPQALTNSKPVFNVPSK